MDDMISRQAAIETVRKAKSIGQAHRMLVQLPSAQPVNIANLQPNLQPNCNQVASDVIGRQAALDFACAMNACDEISDDAYQKLTVHFENMPSAQPGWIPVTERLPRPNEEDGNGFYKAYLVQDGRWMDVARWDGKYWVAWGYSTVLLNVVAWCELPTPYREGGQENA